MRLRSSSGSRLWRNGLNSSPGELCNVLRVRDHREVARRHFDDGCTHARGEQPLGIGWKGLIVGGNQVPRGQRLPGRDSHDFLESCGGQRLLNGVKDSRFYGINVSREMVDK